MLESYDSRTEAEHNALDKELTKNIDQLWVPAFEPPTHRDIWAALVDATCPSKGFKEYTGFFNNNTEELTKLLSAAWETKQFRSVRSLGE